MSVTYWVIEGVGIDTNQIRPFIDKKKLAHMLVEELPDDERLLEIIKEGNYDILDVDSYVYGLPFDNLADILTYCDDSNSLTYGDDDEGHSYLYYPPSMPWQRGPNEPESCEEVHRRIIKAIQVITNLPDKTIDAMIDDYLYRCGAD